MKLSPLEIKKQEFARAFRGYDTEEVQAFLQMMSSQWETLLEENRRLEEDVREYKNKIEHYEKVEEALQDALETARETAKEKVENAEQRAENMIEQAEQKAEQIREEARKDRYAMKREVSKLKHRREEIVARLRAFLMSEMEMLAQYEEEDPIGFIKFLPQHREEEELDRDRIEEAMDDIPGERELVDGPESPRRSASESESNVEHTGEGAGGLSTAREEANESEEPSGSSAAAGERSITSSEPSEPGDTSNQADHQPPSAADEGPEKKQSWRVHSVVSSPPGSGGSSQRGRQESKSESSSPEQQTEEESQKNPEDAASSEEMDKIRRILDELE